MASFNQYLHISAFETVSPRIIPRLLCIELISCIIAIIVAWFSRPV